MTTHADLICVQVDRFNNQGNKSSQNLRWSSAIWVPHFLNHTMAVDNIPFRVIALSYHLGLDFHSGHYRTALWTDTHWLLLDDDAPPEKHSVLPDAVLRTVCILWLLMDGAW